MSNLDHQLNKQLEELTDKGLKRHLVPIVHSGNGTITVSGKRYINLSGNDYLGLATDRELIADFYRHLDWDNLLTKFGPGATASRLMTGNLELYTVLEQKLCSLYGSERALVFNSGYHGNIGILPVLAEKGDLIVADKLCHASLIDGMRLSRADLIRYNHQDYEQLQQIITREREKHNRVFLVTESVFSMDGDLADLDRLVEMKNSFDCILYVDEAHGVGVFGQHGLGLAEERGVLRQVDLLFGTCGKAMAGQGGFLVCSSQIGDFLVNRARSLIYSTGLPPVSLNWLLVVLDRMTAMQEQRRKVRETAHHLRQELRNHGLRTGGASQIVPVLIGDSDAALKTASLLRDSGYWVTAVRPPTVPVNTARLRLSITASHKREDLASLPELIARAIR